MSGKIRLGMMIWIGFVLMAASCGPNGPAIFPGFSETPRVLLDAGHITGPDGALVEKLLKDRLAENRISQVPGQAPLIQAVNGQVQVQIEDESGRDLVGTKVPTERTESKKVKDFFTNKDFTVKEPVMEERVREVPFVFRRASLTLKYTLTPPHPGATDQSESEGTITTRFEQKYGGINEGSRLGFDLAELPAREATIAVLSDRLADRLTTLTPAGESRFKALLQRARGQYREATINEGVREAQAGNWDKAESLWANVLERDPENAVALYNMGLAYERRGETSDLSKAYDYYTRAAIQVDDKAYRSAVTRVLTRMKE